MAARGRPGEAPATNPALGAAPQDHGAGYLRAMAALQKLLALERRLDNCVASKNLALRTSLGHKIQRTLTISCQAEYSPYNVEEPELGEFTIWIRGALEAKDGSHSLGEEEAVPFVFADVLERAEVQLDAVQYPIGSDETMRDGLVTCTPERGDGATMSFTRPAGKAFQDFTAQIKLVFKQAAIPLDYSGPAPALAVLAHKHVGTLQTAVLAIWRHIQDNGLLEKKNSVVKCDETLRKIFGAKMVRRADISTELVNVLGADYQPETGVAVPVSKTKLGTQGLAQTEVLVDPGFSQHARRYLAAQPARAEECAPLQRQIDVIGQQIADRKRKRSFMLRFCDVPAAFSQQVLQSQRRDAAVANHGPAGYVQASKCARSSDQRDLREWTEDAVSTYVQSKAAAKARGF